MSERSTLDIQELLEEREERYGSFEGHADVSQAIKRGMEHFGYRWDELVTDQREALEMIAHKIARILNGDPNYIDNWDDIAGYATLVANRLRAEQNKDPNLPDRAPFNYSTDLPNRTSSSGNSPK